ncbi:MAG: FliG C-terminal domain-containing protein [Pirellulales bacterium]
MTTSPRSLRKAAILVASLDAEHSEGLLRQMSPAQAQLLRQAVERLGEIDPSEQGEVIEEFFRIGPLVPDEDHSGIELDAPLPASMAAAVSRDSPLAACVGEGSLPFRFLDEAPPEKLAPFLAREHAQTIAVVMSHLPADRAAEILAHLPAELQIEVARRLVDLEETDDEVLREVERGLESWLCSEVRGERRQTAGVAALAGILSAASPRARHSILSNLARHDRELAGKLDLPVGPELSFADLQHMDSASLAVVLHHAGPELLLLALAGAAPRFAERAIELFGADDARPLGEALCNLGPTRLSDVEEAQQQLAELARQLEVRGEITPEIRGRLSVAV